MPQPAGPQDLPPPVDLSPPVGCPPFSFSYLDDLMEKAGMDVLLATSKHNVHYLTGGHRHFFFDHADAIGVSRYLPIVIYEKGRPHNAAYIANRNEKDALHVHASSPAGFWIPHVIAKSSGSADAARYAVEHIGKVAIGRKRVGIEMSFLPADAADVLRAAFPDSKIVDAFRPLELLRSRKTDRELEMLRQASDFVVDSMLAVMTGHAPGATKRQLADALRREEIARGLTFEYCLVTTGTGIRRAPADNEIWGPGQIMSLDSGGTYEGYIGDLCRMAIFGEPDAELVDLLDEVDRIQQAARRAAQLGARGGDVHEAGEAALHASPNARHLHFVAHGMGLVSHEAPRLTASGPIPYPASDADEPLASGTVLSIETTLIHPRRGFIKLEDTVAVTKDGPVGFGDRGRSWTRGAG